MAWYALSDEMEKFANLDILLSKVIILKER